MALDGAPATDREAPEGDAKPEQRKARGRRPWTATVFHVSQTDLIPS